MENDDWSATWGLEDSDIGIQEHADDVRELVATVIDDIRAQWGADHDLAWR